MATTCSIPNILTRAIFTLVVSLSAFGSPSMALAGEYVLQGTPLGTGWVKRWTPSQQQEPETGEPLSSPEFDSDNVSPGLGPLFRERLKYSYTETYSYQWQSQSGEPAPSAENPEPYVVESNLGILVWPTSSAAGAQSIVTPTGMIRMNEERADLEAFYDPAQPQAPVDLRWCPDGSGIKLAESTFLLSGTTAQITVTYEADMQLDPDGMLMGQLFLTRCAPKHKTNAPNKERIQWTYLPFLNPKRKTGLTEEYYVHYEAFAVNPPSGTLYAVHLYLWQTPEAGFWPVAHEPFFWSFGPTGNSNGALYFSSTGRIAGIATLEFRLMQRLSGVPFIDIMRAYSRKHTIIQNH